MTRDEIKEYDWEEIRDALGAYVEWLEEKEPHAVNAINAFRAAYENCPMPDDFD